jgi:hypothetical protein
MDKNSPPTLKERIENHIVMIVLSAIVVGFLAGWAGRIALTEDKKPRGFLGLVTPKDGSSRTFSIAHDFIAFSNGESHEQLFRNEYFVGSQDTVHIIPIPGLPPNARITHVSAGTAVEGQKDLFAKHVCSELPKEHPLHDSCIQFVGRAHGKGTARLKLVVDVTYSIPDGQ